MIWARMLAYMTGTVDQELSLRNEHLTAENRILRAQIKGRLLLSDPEKATLAEIAHRLGRKALKEVAAAAKPDTLLARDAPFLKSSNTWLGPARMAQPRSPKSVRTGNPKVS